VLEIGVYSNGKGISKLMTKSRVKKAWDFYTETYDSSVPDWSGEIDFYKGMATEVKSKGQSILEVACGTGRVGIRLAKEGVRVVGLDLSAGMLKEAARKSQGMANVRWVKGDMCSFDLDETFRLVLITGHAFHNLNEPAEQAACLESIHRHLLPDGRLVIHLDFPDFTWLSDLMGKMGGVFEKEGEFQHPRTGHMITTFKAWSYEPSTQATTVTEAFEERDDSGKLISRMETPPCKLHSIFRFEMEHLLARTGFVVDAVYGNFEKEKLNDKSKNMIWVVRKR
jgi:ubiquinone/menaquinone biosynthesis C-methylase UbiE